jgi:hypothetical protein
VAAEALVSGPTFARRQLEEALAFAEDVERALEGPPHPTGYPDGVCPLCKLQIEARQRIRALRAWLAAPSVFADQKLDPLAGGAA